MPIVGDGVTGGIGDTPARVLPGSGNRSRSAPLGVTDGMRRECVGHPRAAIPDRTARDPHPLDASRCTG